MQIPEPAPATDSVAEPACKASPDSKLQVFHVGEGPRPIYTCKVGRSVPKTTSRTKLAFHPEHSPAQVCREEGGAVAAGTCEDISISLTTMDNVLADIHKAIDRMNTGMFTKQPVPPDEGGYAGAVPAVLWALSAHARDLLQIRDELDAIEDVLRQEVR